MDDKRKLVGISYYMEIYKLKKYVFIEFWKLLRDFDYGNKRIRFMFKVIFLVIIF